MWGCSQRKIKLYCLGLHLAGLTLRVGSQKFHQASFIGSKRKKKPKELRSCSIPHPLNAYNHVYLAASNLYSDCPVYSTS